MGTVKPMVTETRGLDPARNNTALIAVHRDWSGSSRGEGAEGPKPADPADDSCDHELCSRRIYTVYKTGITERERCW